MKWHKKECENILKAVNVQVTYGDEIEVPESWGTYTTVGNEEHDRIIRLYLDENLSMHGVAKMLGRSAKTIHDHIKGHNEAIEKDGVCLTFQRMKSPHYIEMAAKRRKGG